MASIPQLGRRQTVSSLNPYPPKPPAPKLSISMAWWLTLPLASLVFASSLLVGGLILRQSKHNTDRIAQQLEQEISDRTLAQLETWIDQPKTINQLNQIALSQQSLSLTEPEQLTQHFLTQLQTFSNLHQLVAVDGQGRSISLSRQSEGEDGDGGYRLRRTSVTQATASTASQNVAPTTSTPIQRVTETRLLDINGDTIQTLPAAPREDLRQTDWYQQAQADSKPIWVKAFEQGEAIAARQVATTAPNKGQSQGQVVATVLDLAQINLFLTQLKLPAEAQVFILDDSGMLLSSSTPEGAELRDRQGIWRNRPASASQDPITRAAADYLMSRWTGTFPNEAQPFHFEIDGQAIRGQTLSYTPYEGANWLIAIALPEASILGPIRAQQRQLLILCLGLLLLSLLLCRWLAQWITRPLRHLNRATQALGQGHWKLDLSDGLSNKRSDELGELARSFDWMSSYLQDNFRQLEGQKRQLQQRNQVLSNEKSRLEELDRFKDEFLATTTQELRIPLSGILGLAESLQAQAAHPAVHPVSGPKGNPNHQTDESQQEASRQAAIELIIYSARRLTTLINDLIDLSKAKNDSLKLSCSGIDLHRVAQHVMALCAPLAAPKKLRLINHIPSAFPLAYGDSQRVQQIFYHLVNNAIKFTPDGEISISAEIIIPESRTQISAKPDPQITAHRASQNAAHAPSKGNAAPLRHLAITISDTGVGLKPELQAQLSQAFQRSSGGASHRYGGTGLGLTIVQTFVELHGGRVEVRSRPTQGSQFRFTLPILEAAAVRIPRPQTSSPRQTSIAQSAYTTRPQGTALGDRTDRTSVTAIQPTTAIQSPPNSPSIPETLGDAVATEFPRDNPNNSSEGPEELDNPEDQNNIYSTFVQRTAVQPPSHEESTTPTLPPLDSAARSAALLANILTRGHTSGATTPKRDRKPRARILVIDDDAINLEVLLRQLSLDDYKVVSATNGEEALRLLDPAWGHESFDLVILEVMMPRMSGYEVCRRIREHYPSYQLPVIMLTAKVQVQDVVEGFRAGANDYLRKPFSSDELRSRIQTHLTNRLYGRFVPAHFLQFLQKSSIADINLGNQISCDMTVMFSDIRSFATLSETMSPQENFDFINSYFQCVSPEVRRHQGFIVKYLGDGMMAIFPENAADAIAAGIAQLKQLNQANKASSSTSSRPPIQVGIGIHHGPMMVGIVGEAQRMQGDAFSDDVNLTARLEGLTKFYGVSMLITDQVLEQLEPDHPFHIRLLDKVQVKGRAQPLPIYEVFDGDRAESRDRKTQTRLHFEAGVHCYQAGEFVAAQGHFRAVTAVNPKDRPAKLYCRRVAKLIAAPPADNWTGVSVWGRK